MAVAVRSDSKSAAGGGGGGGGGESGAAGCFEGMSMGEVGDCESRKEDCELTDDDAEFEDIIGLNLKLCSPLG